MSQPVPGTVNPGGLRHERVKSLWQSEPRRLNLAQISGALSHEGNMRDALQGNTSSPRDNILITDSGQLISQFRMQ